MTNNPLVSVKMITYNHEAYIARAVDGVLRQQVDFPFELVIGEDASTDRTGEIVRELQEKNPAMIRVIRSEQNVGMHLNSERTLAMCRGRYIAFCEGDDYWHDPLKLKKQIDYLERHPEIGMVHSDGILHIVETGDRTVSFLKERGFFNDQEDVLRALIEWKYIVISCSVVVRRILIEEIYRECPYELGDSFPMRDTQTWIEVAYRSQVKYLPEPMVTRNILPESASQTKDLEKACRFANDGIRLRFHYAGKYGGEYTREIKRAILREQNAYVMKLALGARNFNLAAEVVQRSREYHVPLEGVRRIFIHGSRNRVLFHTVITLAAVGRIVKRAIPFI